MPWTVNPADAGSTPVRHPRNNAKMERMLLGNDRMITRIRIDAMASDMPKVDEEIAKVEELLIQSGLLSEAALSNAHITEEVFERIARGNNVGDSYKGRRVISYLPDTT